MLFAIYINDLPEVVQRLIFLFAADSKPFRSIVSDLDVAQLQADIDNFLVWVKNWLLNINSWKRTMTLLQMVRVMVQKHLLNILTLKRTLMIFLTQNEIVNVDLSEGVVRIWQTHQFEL